MKEEELLNPEFLTSEQIPTRRQPMQNFPLPKGVRPMNQMAQDQVNNQIPNLEEEPQFVSSDRIREIDEQITLADKDRLAEDDIRQEVENTSSKYLNVPKPPKDLLKELMKKGEMIRTERAFGYDWTFRALDEGDILMAMEDLKDSISTQAGRIASIMFSKVVYSIEAINGIPLATFFPEITPAKYTSKIEYIIALKRALRSYLVGMPPSIIDTLYTMYDTIERDRDEAVLKLKNS